MDSYKGVIEIVRTLTDYGVMLPSNPYDARNLEESLYEFLDRFFQDAYDEGAEDNDGPAYDRGFDNGYDQGFDRGQKEGYDEGYEAGTYSEIYE